jgi:hypothetical protein
LPLGCVLKEGFERKLSDSAVLGATFHKRTSLKTPDFLVASS